MPPGESGLGVDPELKPYEEETDKVSEAAREGIENLDEDVMEQQKKELQEFSEEVEEKIKYLESIQEDVCTTEHGPNWRDVIAKQDEAEA